MYFICFTFHIYLYASCDYNNIRIYLIYGFYISEVTYILLLYIYTFTRTIYSSSVYKCYQHVISMLFLVSIYMHSIHVHVLAYIYTYYEFIMSRHTLFMHLHVLGVQYMYYKCVYMFYICSSMQYSI